MIFSTKKAVQCQSYLDFHFQKVLFLLLLYFCLTADLLAGRPAVAKAMARQARPDKNRTSLRDKKYFRIKIIKALIPLLRTIIDFFLPEGHAVFPWPGRPRKR
jgi:uncharacterized membrane protein